MDERASDNVIDSWARSAQRGDELALERLLRAVRPRVVRWSLVQTQSADDAEDIAQKVLLRARSALPGFAFTARFTTWLYSITRSVVADARRTQRRRDDLLAVHAPVEVTMRDPGVDEQRLVALVRQHFVALPVRQREVFDLVDLQGKSPADVAELLGMNPTTVRVHLLRARRTVRKRILERNAALVEDR